MLSEGECRDLAGAFAEADYTVDAVLELIGEPAQRALGRNSTVAATRAIGDRDDPLATLTLLWPLQHPVRRRAADAALPGLVRPLIDAGILRETDDAVSATLDIRPYGSDDGAEGHVVSDLTPNLDGATTLMRPHFVLGVSSASSTLAQLTIRRPVQRALDLGTGCGVQALHLARHAEHITATDLNPRALELAALTARLNGIELDLRLGSLYEPVADETFDLITSNPPYVMSPPTGERLTYREGVHSADGLVEQVIRQGAQHLDDQGLLQVLANWAHLRGIPWDERLATWLEGSGCDAHIVQREVLDPYEYVELWLADAGLTGHPTYRARYDAWLQYFDELGIEAVGMGWLTLRKTSDPGNCTTIEDWPFALEQPIAPAFASGFDAIDALRRAPTDQHILDTHWRLADDVIEETQGQPGMADPQHVIFRQQRGFRRAEPADTALAAVLGACDGDLSLGQIVTGVARILDIDTITLQDHMVATIPRLARSGYLRDFGPRGAQA